MESTTSRYAITFLFDEKNDWLSKYLSYIDYPTTEKYAFSFSKDYKAIKKQDIVFVLGYTRILDETFLADNRLVLVVHESNLPQGKGFSPVMRQVLNGTASIPICLIQATNAVDSGDILLKSSFALNGSELYDEIRAKQAEATKQIISEFLTIYPDYSLTRQVGNESFFKKMVPKDHELDVDETIRNQFNKLRIGNNNGWPSFFLLDGKTYVIKIFKRG